MLKKKSTKQKALIIILCISISWLAIVLPVLADLNTNAKNLTGQVEQSESNNDDVAKLPLANMGKTTPGTGYLKGVVEQEEGQTNKENPVADKGDPDAQDKELMIEWDHWRNRFFQAVLSGTTDNLNSNQAQNFQFNPQTKIIESKYSFGTAAWFSCSVGRDRQIKDVRIEQSSGFVNYDQAVLEAVQSLAGSGILTFPSRSKRVSVLQAGGVERTAQNTRQYFHFGDVEHYHVPQ